MNKYNINHYATYSDLKASIVERFNRTVKQKLWRSFTVNGNYKWLDTLPLIIKEYNNTIHRTIKMKPKDVTKKHEQAILARVNIKQRKLVPKYKVNDLVRISKHKTVFKKGYLPNWTNEVFKVLLVNRTTPITYTLQDMKGNVLLGGFYESELNRSKTGDVYLVEKVLKRRGNKALVRWLGFDKREDNWIDIKNLL
jgi:hypothetical protein